MKKTLIIAGAGQFGRSAAGLLNHSTYDLLALADNSEALQGTVFRHPLHGALPILSMEEAVAMRPDTILTGIIDDGRTKELRSQLLSLGFYGEILTLKSLYETVDVRSATLLRLAQRVEEQKIPGETAELGVYKGDLAWKLNALFPERELYLFDTFTGFDDRDITQEKELQTSRAAEGDFGDTSVEAVRSRLPFPEKAHFEKGFFPETAEGLSGVTYAFVSLDADLYAPILAGLEYFCPRLAKGGMILLHDYGNTRFRGAKKAVEAYEALHGPLPLVPLCDLHGSAVILNPEA